MTDTRELASALRRAFRLAALGVVGGALIAAAAQLYLRLTQQKAEVAARPTTVALETRYKDEEHWLASLVIDDLAGMASLARRGRGDGAIPLVSTGKDAAGRLTVSVKKASGSESSETLHLEHSIWSPEDYEPIATRLLADVRMAALAPSKPVDEEALLGRLLEMDAGTIETENERISSALAGDATDPRLHEEAALLLAAFALREAGGYFVDGRQLLCRVTAHLAFARALRGGGPQSLSGRYAAVVLSKLVKRSAEAEAALERLRAEAHDSKVQEAWRRALLMRVTDDWRLLPNPDSATNLERFEWLRATLVCLSSARALQVLERLGSGPGYAVDWALILSWSPSVEVGNQFLDAGREMLLAEVDDVWKRTHGSALSPAHRIAALSDPAQPFLSKDGPRVIAWGTWAAQYQRHLLHLIRQAERHERHMLRLRESADRTASDLSRAFSGLTLFPLLAAHWESEKKAPDRTVLDAAVTFAGRHPEMVTAFGWTEIEKATHGLPRRLPARATWFGAGPPRGTGHDLTSRLDLLPRDSTREPPLAALAALKALAPKDYYVSYHRLSYEAKKRALTRPEAEAEFGSRLEYDDRVLSWLVEWFYESDPAFVRILQENRCALDGNECSNLGAACVNDGDEACAVAAYERMSKEAPDAVLVSNSSWWLMEYHLRHGGRRRAVEIARGAASVGSKGGMLTLASFLEETGEVGEAETLIRKARDRYPPEDEKELDWVLIGFYHRMAHVRGVRSYETRFTTAAKDAFPAGLEPVRLSSFQAPPSDGVLFTSETPALRRQGMRKGDVAVALNGWRLRTSRQLYAVREFDYDPQMTFIIWRAGQYLEIPARRINHRFGMELANYKPVAPKASTSVQ